MIIEIYVLLSIFGTRSDWEGSTFCRLVKLNSKTAGLGKIKNKVILSIAGDVPLRQDGLPTIHQEWKRQGFL